MLVAVLSILAVVLSIVANLPQLLHLLRVRTTAGLSLLSWQAISACGLGWTLHGSALRNPTLVIPNVLLALSAILIVGLIVRQRRLGWLRSGAPVVVLGVGMFALGRLFGPVAFAVAAFLPSVTGLIGQAVDLVRSARVAGVSLSGLLFQLVTQLAWLAWALVTREPSVTIVAAVIGAAYAVNVGLLLFRLGTSAGDSGNIRQAPGIP